MECSPFETQGEFELSTTREARRGGSWGISIGDDSKAIQIATAHGVRRGNNAFYLESKGSRINTAREARRGILYL